MKLLDATVCWPTLNVVRVVIRWQFVHNSYTNVPSLMACLLIQLAGSLFKTNENNENNDVTYLDRIQSKIYKGNSGTFLHCM